MAHGISRTGEAHKRLVRTDGQALAMTMTDAGSPSRPTILWLSGFKSDMLGTKAERVAAFAARHAIPCVRFDYFGHGESTGDFAAGTISRWRDDALAVIDEVTRGPLVLVGSSMGAWIAMLAALARPQRVRDLIFIAPALDFTERLMWQGFDDATRTTIMRDGVYARPSLYGPDPYPVTRGLIEDGRKHLLLDREIVFSGRVRILQGMEDRDVPFLHALQTTEQLSSADVVLTLIKDGDHRLSREADLARLEGMLAELLSSQTTP